VTERLRYSVELCEQSWASEKRIYMVEVSNCSVCVCLKTELTVGLREAFAYRISPSTTTVSVDHAVLKALKFWTPRDTEPLAISVIT